jgi:lactate permease
MPDTITERPAMRNERADAHQQVETEAPMGFAMSFLPDILLTALTIGALVIDPVKRALGAFSVGLPFPSVTTGYGIVRDAVAPYSPFAPLTHPGTFLLITALVTWAVYRWRGYFQVQARAGGNEDGDQSVLGALFTDAVPASVPVIAFLAMAQIMNHSGQNDVLALGIAAAAPAMVFAFLSSSIGALGAFMTSSSTSSNVLFSNLQQSVAQLKSLPEASIIAAQSAGGALGNAIAPANVVLGASTAGISGQEGAIIRKTLPWTIVAVLLTGAATVLLVWLFP